MSLSRYGPSTLANATPKKTNRRITALRYLDSSYPVTGDVSSHTCTKTDGSDPSSD